MQKYASSRFAHEAAPALTGFANSLPRPFDRVEIERRRGDRTLKDTVQRRLRLVAVDFQRGEPIREDGALVDFVSGLQLEPSPVYSRKPRPASYGCASAASQVRRRGGLASG